MSTRLGSFVRAIDADDWPACAGDTFAAYFQLPRSAGMKVAVEAVARYAATFGRAYPEISWPSDILRDPGAWVNEFGRNADQLPPGARIADGSWLLCLDALLLGSSASDDVVRVAALATATVTSIQSRAILVWEADDPEAVELWAGGLLKPERSYAANAAGRAVLEREWRWTAARLTSEFGAHEPLGVDQSRLAAALERWRANEYQLIMPAPPDGSTTAEAVTDA